jgi:hypothetical protein
MSRRALLHLSLLLTLILGQLAGLGHETAHSLQADSVDCAICLHAPQLKFAAVGGIPPAAAKSLTTPLAPPPLVAPDGRRRGSYHPRAPPLPI